MSAGTSNITNLKAFRKRKARDEKRARGDENAVKFGRSKAQKEMETGDAARARVRLDGHKRDGQKTEDPQ